MDIAIEDSGAGIISAKASGIFCVVLRNQFLKDSDASLADFVINSIDEIVKMIKSVL